MIRFRVKIITFGVASSTESRQDEAISVSSYSSVFSQESICDYNILIIRLENIYSYNDVIQFSNEELDEFFGKPSIIVCFSDVERYFESDIQYWISPPDVRTPIAPKKIRNYDWLPRIEGLKVLSKKGKSIQPTSEGGRFTNLLNTYNWEWKCSFSKLPQKYVSIARNISGQDVALRADIGEGRVFIIPTPEVNITDFEKYPTFLRQLIDVCEEEIQALSEQGRKEPDWVQQQVDPLESKLFDDFIPLYERYQTVRGARKLLYEAGTRLTRIVHFVISKMEFKAEMKEEEGRQDIEICEDDFNLVIEVASSEEHWIDIYKTRQLLDWCRKFEKERNEKPKGILVANPYCNLSPTDRDEPFTPKALEQGADEGFCLMTTVQLYNIFCKFLKGEMDKDKIKELFLNTKGLLEFKG